MSGEAESCIDSVALYFECRINSNNWTWQHDLLFLRHLTLLNHNELTSFKTSSNGATGLILLPASNSIFINKSKTAANSFKQKDRNKKYKYGFSYVLVVKPVVHILLKNVKKNNKLNQLKRDYLSKTWISSEKKKWNKTTGSSCCHI